MPTYSGHDEKLHIQSSLNTGSIYRAKITIFYLVAGCDVRKQSEIITCNY